MKKNKITLLNSIIISTTLIISGCGESEKQDDIFQEETKSVEIKQEPTNQIVQEKNINNKLENPNIQNKVNQQQAETVIENFKDYSGIKITVKDPELQKLINENIKEYENILTTIENDKLVQEKEITEPRIQNINELKADLLKEEENKLKECQVITTANEKACEVIEKNIIGIKNVIAGVEADIKNSLGQLEVFTLNNKRKLNAQMKNNIQKLVAQEKN